MQTARIYLPPLPLPSKESLRPLNNIPIGIRLPRGLPQKEVMSMLNVNYLYHILILICALYIPSQ